LNLIKTGGEVFLYQIIEVSSDIYEITIDKGATGEGIADYGSSSVKIYMNIIRGTWTNLTLLNSYTAFSGSETPQYKVDLYGNLSIRGTIKSNTTTDVHVATLPVGARPFKQMMFRVITRVAETPANAYTLVISTSGVISVQDDTGSLVANSSEIVIDLPMMTIY
jgi:hypothetical protein